MSASLVRLSCLPLLFAPLVRSFVCPSRPLFHSPLSSALLFAPLVRPLVRPLVCPSCPPSRSSSCLPLSSALSFAPLVRPLVCPSRSLFCLPLVCTLWLSSFLVPLPSLTDPPFARLLPCSNFSLPVPPVRRLVASACPASCSACFPPACFPPACPSLPSRLGPSVLSGGWSHPPVHTYLPARPCLPVLACPSCPPGPPGLPPARPVLPLVRRSVCPHARACSSRLLPVPPAFRPPVCLPACPSRPSRLCPSVPPLPVRPASARPSCLRPDLIPPIPPVRRLVASACPACPSRLLSARLPVPPVLPVLSARPSRPVRPSYLSSCRPPARSPAPTPPAKTRRHAWILGKNHYFCQLVARERSGRSDPRRIGLRSRKAPPAALPELRARRAATDRT